jgi:hypothetical protein
VVNKKYVQIADPLWIQLEYRMRSLMGHQLDGELWSKMWGRIGQRLRDQLRSQLWGHLEVQLRDVLHGK